MATKRERDNRIQVSLEFIVKRFPLYSESIRQLFQDDNSFQSLCEDYHVCAKALDHWNEATSEEAPDRQQEYATLLKELEDEILKYLKQTKSMKP